MEYSSYMNTIEIILALLPNRLQALALFNDSYKYVMDHLNKKTEKALLQDIKQKEDKTEEQQEEEDDIESQKTTYLNSTPGKIKSHTH